MVELIEVVLIITLEKRWLFINVLKRSNFIWPFVQMFGSWEAFLLFFLIVLTWIKIVLTWINHFVFLMSTSIHLLINWVQHKLRHISLLSVLQLLTRLIAKRMVSEMVKVRRGLEGITVMVVLVYSLR